MGEPRCRVSGVEVHTDLECGNADTIREAGEARIEVSPREDPIPHELQVQGPISCYQVCVLLTNTGEARADLTVDVLIPAWLTEAGFGGFLRKTYLERPAGRLEWDDIPADRIASLDNRMRVSVSLGAGEERVVSSAAHYPYSTCVSRLRALGGGPDADLVDIGCSVEGRTIWALQTRRGPKLPRIVVTGTLQPGEPAAWGVMAMADWLYATDEGAGLRERFDVDLVPQPNPDGIVHGWCNVNASGDLPTFRFADAATGLPCPQETRVVWDYLAADPPLGYIDFHFMHQTDHPDPKIMFGPLEAFTVPGRGKAVEKLGWTLAEAGGYRAPMFYQVGQPLWHQLAVCQAPAAMDTVSYIDQFTGPKSSWEKARVRGPFALRTFAEALTALIDGGNRLRRVETE